ncbi:hypothetical protein FHT86_005595 [Rhizobium sp. BK313]|uniref:hypothetical protein n=1 Tax=Rhizobium sp. BK313 TaxID=2587081 RepID=UPI00105C4F7B|nr:hypothetical protein [Rhizobium sp. BK313]MBB3457277.1 hypothetical protein [Rhizobium sp. BK313]
MAPSHSLTWYSAANTSAWDVYSTATSGSNSLILKPAEATLSTALGLNGAAGTSNRVTNIYSGGSLRWTVGATSTAETGGNAGKNFAFAAFSDTGAFLSTPIIINRGLGTVILSSLIGTGNRAVCVDPNGVLYAHAVGSC